jgi:arginase
VILKFCQTDWMDVDVLLVPYDSGRRCERMGRGPGRLLAGAVAPLLTRLGIQFRADEITLPDGFRAEIRTAFEVCREVAGRVRQSRGEGRFPLVLSGNCNVAVGTVAGCGCASTGVVWFDAHGEATTPDTTTSGFLDGMGISILTGKCWRNLAQSIPEFAPMAGSRITLVGARDTEPAEEALLAELGVRRELGALPDTGVYAHFDLDVLDPGEAVWNQWAPAGGLSVDGVRGAVREIRAATPIRAAGMASYDPDSDGDGRAVRAAAAILEAVFADSVT